MKHDNDIHKFTATGALVTLGIIFGDIGTSPLYVLKAIVGEKIISADLILGGLSCVIWTLTLQTTIKYVILTLQADNNGEGGVFSLYALVRKKTTWLTIPAILGGSALLADGMITPPISVSSAIEGLHILNPDIPTVPIVIFIILILFFFQRFGTSTVGKAFGPMMLVWFSMLAILGTSSLLDNPDVLVAFNPYYAYNLLANYPEGFWLLGAVFLCTTGAEALYSDLGHCGRENIRVSWVFVKICLLLNYLGQSAWLLSLEGGTLNQRNPFFSIMPDWFLVIGILIATFATIIASQALISGSFTLISEAIHLDLWPKVKLSYPSNMRGQLYVSSLNLILAIGCIVVVLYFQESTKMEAAYGLAITLTMMMTSILLCYYLYSVKKVATVLVILFIFVYAAIEISFFIANLEKFPQGGWFSLAIGALFSLVMIVFYRAKKIIHSLKEFIRFSPYVKQLVKISNDDNMPKFATHLVYMTSTENEKFIEKKIIHSIFNSKPKRADIFWFVHVDITDEPYTMKFKVDTIIPNTVMRLTLMLGFRVELRVDYFFKQILAGLIKNKEVDLEDAGEYQKLIGEQVLGDFTFIVLESFLSNASELPWYDDFVMQGYFLIKTYSSSAEDWFGLDPSSVIEEKVPIVISPKGDTHLSRNREASIEILHH